MITRAYVLPAALAIMLSCMPAAQAELKVEADKDNVVSSRLEGRWAVNAVISTRLGRNQGGLIEFKTDKNIVKRIPKKYEEFLANKTIYMAGTFTRFGKSFPFILLEIKGNPHIVCFRDRDGEPFGDAESFNVMLAVAKDSKNDLLFVGGDFNNQPFTAYERSDPKRQ